MWYIFRERDSVWIAWNPVESRLMWHFRTCIYIFMGQLQTDNRFRFLYKNGMLTWEVV